MVINKIIDFETDENCYIIHNENSSECVVIDPGNSFEKIKNELEKKRLKPVSILLTHCHFDHTSSVQLLKEFSGARVTASKKCMENIKSPVTNVSGLFGESFGGDYVDEAVSEGKEFVSAGLKIKCIETPGHTNCSVCYLIGDNLFSGDTLFLRTTGRWDLPTGNYDELVNSLKKKLYLMEDYIKVYPGHGSETTLGYEKKFNMSISFE